MNLDLDLQIYICWFSNTILLNVLIYKVKVIVSYYHIFKFKLRINS